MPNRTRVVDFVPEESGVLATAENLDTGERFEISAVYLVGCDGAHSDVRRKMGAKFSGDVVVMETQSTHIRRAPTACHDPKTGVVKRFPQSAMLRLSVRDDGRERWLIHNWRPPTGDLATLDCDRSMRQILGVDSTFPFEILAKEDWTGRRMIAERFRDRRVFLCGDAAHIWVPFAGYGMNAGIADAMNLSWKFAGVMNGWAEPAILDAYELERQPVTEQVSRYAMNTSFTRESLGSSLPHNLEEFGPEGDAVRARIGKSAYEQNVGQFCCGGLNFGYFYKNSPIIAYDGEEAPEYTIYDFVQSTVPGCRTPHVWLRSMFTSFGYFNDRQDDRTVLENMFTSLEPGGACIIEVLGKERLAKILQPTISTVLPDGTLMVERHEIFDDWTRVRNEWLLIRNGRAKSFKFHHTIYSGQELRDRMERVGFVAAKLHGNLDGDEYGPNAERLIAIGGKPASTHLKRRHTAAGDSQ